MSKEEMVKSNKGYFEELSLKEKLIVSFGGVGIGTKIPKFEFVNSLIEINCDKVYIRDLNKAWYQCGIDNEINSPDKLIDYLSKITKGYKKVTFIGNSMGGYAAILFGSIVGAQEVIAFAPQTYIDKWNRLINRDFRWRDQLKQSYLSKVRKKEYFNLKRFLINNNNENTLIQIFYCPEHRLDKSHAVRMSMFSNIMLNPVNGGHGVVKTIRDNGKLNEILIDSENN